MKTLGLKKINVNILLTLKLLFHFPYMVLIVYPYLIGILINYSMSDIRELLILFSWLPLFIWPCIVFRKVILSHIVSVLLFINGFANLSHWLLIKAPLSATGVFVFFNSNLQEASEFVLQKNSWFLLLLIPYFLIIIWAIRKPLNTSTKVSRVYFLIFILYSILFISENAIHERLLRKGVPVLVKTSISFYYETKSLQQAILENKNKKVIAKRKNNTTFTFVLIIGESANRNHMSIYGYNKETNPHLKNDSDLIVFKNVISPYCHTLEAVRTAITTSNIDNKMKYNEAISIINVAKAAGYKTFWISNQSPLGIWDNFITVLAKTSNVYSFHNISGSSSTETGFKKSDDMELLPSFKEALIDTAKYKLIILHLMGSHGQYCLRYPIDFEKFNYGSDKKSVTISEYDNSILYTDFVVDTILKTLKAVEGNKSASLLYFSDHGENVYDDSDNVGHDYADSIPYSIVEIPFMLWFSDKYKNQANSELYILAQNRIDSPFMTDDLFHSLVSILQIETAVFDSTRSLFSPYYNQLRKRNLENGKIYLK